MFEPTAPDLSASDAGAPAAPPGAASEQSWLAVTCADAGLLLPLNDAGEISAYAGAVRVPHVRPWFLGVANLRGQLQGVVDLGGFLGLRSPADELAGGWLVALNTRLEAHCALRVDQLAGLRHEAELLAVEPGPDAEAGRPRFAGRSFREAAGARIWQEIRLSELAVDGFFLDIIEPIQPSSGSGS
ncbi:chemotaxis protein CheW [Piscinibacter sakaiensis]|uniref:chemotaxis protein CheW n=1 Tax=Piscinibacter sakaiensis TaxID=1547922 RepID=UPI003AACAD53